MRIQNEKQKYLKLKIWNNPTQNKQWTDELLLSMTGAMPEWVLAAKVHQPHGQCTAVQLSSRWSPPEDPHQLTAATRQMPGRSPGLWCRPVGDVWWGLTLHIHTWKSLPQSFRGDCFHPLKSVPPGLFRCKKVSHQVSSHLNLIIINPLKLCHLSFSCLHQFQTFALFFGAVL